MTAFTVAAVQAAYVLMDRDATIDRVAALTAEAAAQGRQARGVSRGLRARRPDLEGRRDPIWDGDEAWYSMLVDQAIVVPSEATERLGAIAREHGVTLVVGIDEREPEPRHDLQLDPLLRRRTGACSASTASSCRPARSARSGAWATAACCTVVDTEIGRVGGLICWENYMPLARYYMYSQGIDVWVAPTLATGDAWVATMRHIAREGRLYVVGVNPCVRVDQIPDDFPARDKVWKLE